MFMPSAWPVGTDYVDDPFEDGWALFCSRLLQIATYVSAIRGMTPSQAQFKLPNSFRMPESLSRYVVVVPSDRETFIGRPEAST